MARYASPLPLKHCDVLVLRPVVLLASLTSDNVGTALFNDVLPLSIALSSVVDYDGDARWIVYDVCRREREKLWQQRSIQTLRKLCSSLLDASVHELDKSKLSFAQLVRAAVYFSL